MKRSLDSNLSNRQYTASSFHAWRPVLPASSPTHDDVPKRDENGAQQAPMPFPGPFAYIPAPLPAPDSIAHGGMKGQTGMALHIPAAAGLAAVDARKSNLDWLILTLEANDHEGLAHVLEQGDGDVNAFDSVTGLPPLALATRNGDARAVALLLDHGAEVNLPGKHCGWTALMHAARHGHTGIIEILTARSSIALDMKNSEGGTALHLAARYGQAGAVGRLLAAGAMTAPMDNIGICPLMLAAHRGDIAVAKLLVASGNIDLDKAAVVDRKTALHIAAFSDQTEVAACLLDAGANANLVDAFGDTPLLCAVAESSVGVTRLLAASTGIRLDTVALNGMTALHVSINNDRPELAGCLLAAGARIDICDGQGILPISMAVRSGSAVMVEALLDHGATLQHFNCIADDTPFTIAVADLQKIHGTNVIPAPPFFAQDMEPSLALPPILADMLALMEDGSDLVRWLRSQRIMMPCVQIMTKCLASYSEVVQALEKGGRPLGKSQKLWICTSALSMMSRHKGRDLDLQVYRQAGISAAGLVRLSEAAHREFDRLNTLADQAMTGLGARMFENLVPDCLALTNRSYGADALALENRQLDAGFLPPLAQAIARSWQRALAGIGEMTVTVAGPANHKQLAQALHDQAERTTPALFVTALGAELASRTLLEGLRQMIGEMKNAEILDVLFQIQCNQLRQYCQQMAGAD